MAPASVSPAASDGALGRLGVSAPRPWFAMTLQGRTVGRVARSGPAGGVCP